MQRYECIYKVTEQNQSETNITQASVSLSALFSLFILSFLLAAACGENICFGLKQPSQILTPDVFYQ